MKAKLVLGIFTACWKSWSWI